MVRAAWAHNAGRAWATVSRTQSSLFTCKMGTTVAASWKFVRPKPDTWPGTWHLVRDERTVGDAMVLVAAVLDSVPGAAGSENKTDRKATFGEMAAERAKMQSEAVSRGTCCGGQEVGAVRVSDGGQIPTGCLGTVASRKCYLSLDLVTLGEASCQDK